MSHLGWYCVRITPEMLEERLVEFAASACQMIRGVPTDFATAHICRQLARSCTSPAANYAEARSAESKKDFIHNIQVCLKELRETRVWLKLTRRLSKRSCDIAPIIQECDELIAIFVRSVQTSRQPSKSAIKNR